jgi:hypothetical protein
MSRPSSQADLSKYQVADNAFAHLSVTDLVAARALYHEFLMRHPNVVATAVARYRIRSGDSWPNDARKHHGTGVRRLDNSEVRPYSWPCILVLVDEWQDPAKFASHPSDLVPKTLFLPDGRAVPVCVVEAPREITTPTDARDIVFPVNNIGPGNPIVAEVQGRPYAATIACLVSDGHRVYGLTNRHVTGDPGETVYARVAGNSEPIGVSADKQLTRMPLAALYPNLEAKDTFVNLDVGLIDLDDLSRWTTDVQGIGIVGPTADFSGSNLSLSLIGCHVRGVGAASGDMLGEIQGLFYRYKTGGGFEYVSDLFIGPRAAHSTKGGQSASAAPIPFQTLPGDSGTLWMLEPVGNDGHQGPVPAEQYLPLAMQWGRNMLYSADRAPPQSFALATLLSRVCALLEVDPVRAWNLDQPDTWGSIGHFSIAARTQVALSNRFKTLVTLMKNNAEIISHDDAAILKGDFSGMGSDDFVPMADVPDFFWKPRIGKQGHTRQLEGPNHFADMDQENPDGKTLLDLTEEDDFIDPDKWQDFYNSVTDTLTGEPIKPVHRGLLPFRVWQLFDQMVEFASKGEAENFVCAAGVLTHYVGDACQPLHISYLHDGDPNRPVKHTFQRGKKAGTSEERPMGQGVHSAYEDAMVHDHRKQILDGLLKTPKAEEKEWASSGFEAAKATIELMRNTFRAIAPPKLVQAYINVGTGGKASSDALWKAFGTATIKVMQGGAHLLAVLWESAWNQGAGERNVRSTGALTQKAAMAIVADEDFCPSMSVDAIGSILKRPAGSVSAATPGPARRKK